MHSMFGRQQENGVVQASADVVKRAYARWVQFIENNKDNKELQEALRLIEGVDGTDYQHYISQLGPGYWVQSEEIRIIATAFNINITLVLADGQKYVFKPDYGLCKQNPGEPKSNMEFVVHHNGSNHYSQGIRPGR